MCRKVFSGFFFNAKDRSIGHTGSHVTAGTCWGWASASASAASSLAVSPNAFQNEKAKCVHHQSLFISFQLHFDFCCIKCTNGLFVCLSFPSFYLSCTSFNPVVVMNGAAGIMAGLLATAIYLFLLPI